jgi:alkylation response protein AidB-like acyl-CoA dehydrogenase
MPSTTLTADEADAFAERCRAFLAEHARPSAAGNVAAARAFQGELAAAGLAGLPYASEYGGAGLTLEHERIYRAVAQDFPPMAGSLVISHGMCLPVLNEFGTEEQKRCFMPDNISGKTVWCQMFSEPGAGSDVASLSMRAIKDGDEWIVNGQKVWTTLAHIARWGMLVARTDPDAPKHKGLSYFVVDMHAPGVEVRPLKQMTGDAEFNEVFFNDVRVPDSMRLGPIGEGWMVATTTLMNERATLSGAGSASDQNVGGGAVDDLVVQAKKRGAWEDAALRQRLVQAMIDGRVIKMTNLRSAAARKAGKQPGPEGSITKLFQAEYNKRLQNLAVDVIGAPAMAWPDGDRDTAQAVRGFLRSRANTIEGGTSEIMRNIIGERVLGLPKEPSVDRDMPWSQIPRS